MTRKFNGLEQSIYDDAVGVMSSTEKVSIADRRHAQLCVLLGYLCNESVESANRDAELLAVAQDSNRQIAELRSITEDSNRQIHELRSNPLIRFGRSAAGKALFGASGLGGVGVLLWQLVERGVIGG